MRTSGAAALSALIVASGLAACTTEPEQVRPPVALPMAVHVADAQVFETDAWGYTAVDRAAALVAAHQLPLEVAAGRVIVAAVSSPDPQAAANLVTAEHLAGVIVMGAAVVDSAQVTALTEAVRQAGVADGNTAPLVVSTDHEGGPVARLSPVVDPLPALMASGAAHAAGNVAGVSQAHQALAADMLALGFTVDWAPVADVTAGAGDPTMGVRSAGDDPHQVAAVVDTVLGAFGSQGLLGAVKHFPGHGSVGTDSHLGLPVQGASYQDLLQRDLLPFVEAIESGAPMVMMGHIEVTAWGAGPASTSHEAYRVLRDDLGFDGVAVTDALNMAALSESYPGAATVAALAAGADIALLPPDPAVARAAVMAAVKSGELPRERLDEAVARINLMMRYQSQLVAAAPEVSAFSATDFMTSAAVVSGERCSGSLVDGSVAIRGGTAREREALAAALADYGIGQGPGTTVELLGSARAGTADVVVALDAPWGIPTSGARTTVGLFARSDAAMQALARILVDASNAGGVWPVAGMPASCAQAQ